MIVIRISGGLGNQLFQYALFRKMSESGKTVKADRRYYTESLEMRQYYLDRLGIELDHAGKADLKRYAYDFNYLNLARRKLGLMKCYYDNPTYVFKPDILKISDGYLDGYWQCPEYFDDIRNIIVGEVTFPNLPDKQNEIRKKMLDENSVAVHVRLGDYVTLSERYGNICTKEYYTRAFEYIRSRVPDAVFYGFSDEPELAQDMLDEDIIWLKSNSDENAANDLCLMASCKHNIIANSSFSWWGAYLGRYSEKIVVAPSKWVNSDTACEIWCKDWVRL